MKSSVQFGVLMSLALAANAGFAADAPQPTGVVGLQASATVEVPKDLMTVTLNTTREGVDANTVQSGLKQALDAALAEAKRVAKPGQIDVRTGNFSLYPRYTNKGVISGWQGTSELVIEGRDMQGLGQLTGKISTMTIARVGYGLSREVREQSEGDVTGKAIASYRAKAAEATKQFGFSGYVVREVNVQANEQPGNVIPMMRAQTMSKMADDAALPVEAGKAVVTVTVSGTVQMTK